MKVLFAVNNESISESIIKKYQQEYKEIISSKNVYYFDAITRELQKDKSYDRIVISEDVEPFANNNYGVIDKFIFERLDNISDEAVTVNGQDIPIILICADRRTKSENLLVKLFGIGIYSALIGQDRTISKVCELINKPRSKKDAKIYYRIDSEDVEYKAESEGDVNEVEIQNILNHYKRLGKNEEEYVRSFDNIAEQYTDAQLRVICKFLPLNVKAVLEANSQKYQELITFGTVMPSVSQTNKYVPNQEYHERKKKKNETNKLDIVERNIGKSELTKPVVIPGISSTPKVEENKNSLVTNTNINTNTNSSINDNTIVNNVIEPQHIKQDNELNKNEIEDILQSLENDITENKNEEMTETPKKRRGRPRKVKEVSDVEAPKKKRGRPKKVNTETENNTDGIQMQEDDSPVDLFSLGDTENNKTNGEIILPGLDNEQNLSNIVQEEPVNLFDLTNNEEPNEPISNTREIEEMHQYNQYETDSSLKNLISMSNKLVAFVGTSKNGTSFLVNNIAENLSKKGIKVAILDLTKNKNAYYIYTKNDEELRNVAFNCIGNLKNGMPKGIEVNKNLTVYTTLPERNYELEDYTNILKTLTQNYSLIIMDCDYDTNYAYFDLAKEIYLIQTYDILTIQPLTAFLRNLKSKNILDPDKLRIVLNKVLRVRSITERVIIGGMSSYNDPSMSYMTELFNKDNVKYCTIPFDQEVYSRYLDGLVNCEISTKGYPKNFIASLDRLENMVYPLLNNDKSANRFNSYNHNNSGFSSNINDTLNKMKNRY